MSTIFISYRRSDSQDVAKLIYTWLLGRFPRDTFFLDVTSIDPGRDFRAAIEEAIVRSQLVLVVIGPTWVVHESGVRMSENAADLVRFEVEMALRHTKPVVPLLVNEARMPTSQELPPALSHFTYHNAISLRPQSFFQDLEEVAKIKEHFAPAPRLVSESAPASANEPYAAGLLVMSVFFALFPLFPLVTFFMARSQAIGLRTNPKAATARIMLRVSMIISLIGLFVQGLLLLSALVPYFRALVHV